MWVRVFRRRTYWGWRRRLRARQLSAGNVGQPCVRSRQAVGRGRTYTSSWAVRRGRLGNLFAGLDADLPVVGVSYRAFRRLDLRTGQEFKSMAEAAKRQHEYVAGFGVKPSSVASEPTAKFEKPSFARHGQPSQTRHHVREWRGSRASTRPRKSLRKCLVHETLGDALRLLGCVDVHRHPGGRRFPPFVVDGKDKRNRGGNCRCKECRGNVHVPYLRRFDPVLGRLCEASRKAEKIDGDACGCWQRMSRALFEAQRLLTEYQVARASAPLIPTWIWKIHRNSTNEDYKLRNSKV